MSDFTVYVVGPITHSDGVDWWAEAKEELEALGINVVMPFDQWDFDRNDDYTVLSENSEVTEGTSHVVYDYELMRSVKTTVRDSDALLVGWDMTRRTRGTMTEMVCAYEGVSVTPVVLWARKADDKTELDPAVRYYSNSITHDLSTAIKVVEGLQSV